MRNWDDPPAQFALDGPFAASSQGTTLLPGQEPLRWRISDVQPGQSYTLETQLERAMLSFEWCFDAVSDRRTRLTQRIVLSGDNAAAYAQEVEGSFGANLQGRHEEDRSDDCNHRGSRQQCRLPPRALAARGNGRLAQEDSDEYRS